MAITTRDEVITAVARTLNRSDLNDDIPNWMAMMEERAAGAVTANGGQDGLGGIRIREMLTRTTTIIADRYMALPAGYLEMKLLRAKATSTGEPFDMTEVTPAQITIERAKAVRAGTVYVSPSDRPINMPRFYAVAEQLEFDVNPADFTAAQPYAEFLYYKRPDSIAASGTTNVLLTRSSGAYLYGTLVHSAPFLLNDSRIATWESAYQTIIGTLNATDRKRSGGPQISRVTGLTP